ncbi:hypothetical protein D9757_003466 [Collybiopsis confluens]|uniref:Malic enzyme n=1 Tax=Collybiopsis confluens TaxID=2823264 RepID=A0A8H5MD55_9AGAR|nr:hypothetical protein D9757_003466 [Collybiopsis confluens]
MMMQIRRLPVFIQPLSRAYAPKWPRPKPRTSERPPYRAPDPLINNPAATVTALPDQNLTFIHRPPPTAPSPLSYTTNPVSPLLRPPTQPTSSALPPLSRPSANKPPLEPLAPEQITEIRRLRRSNPTKWTRGRLAEKFGCTQHFVGLVAATKKPMRKKLVQRRDEEHNANRAKWSEKKSLVAAISQKRRQYWFSHSWLGRSGANGLPVGLFLFFVNYILLNPLTDQHRDLYVAGAGIRPYSTLPICLDVGTSTAKFLEDKLYIGVRQKRPNCQEMDDFMEEFMSAMSEVFPELVVQFEDFSTDNAFKYLDVFRSRYRVFNDDIQGTGAVVLSGFTNAARLSSAASGLSLTDHKILFFGAGSSGIGVAKQLLSFFTHMGMSVKEAKQRIYTVDSKGLITADRKGLQEHKRFFARTDYQGPPLTNLTDIVRYVNPTALLGLSTIGGAFTEDVVKLMAAKNERPIIFPLSNPVSKCEVTFEDAIKWTEGRVIFASGSPYKPVIYRGNEYEAGQGNNLYIFPGVGFGSILSKAKYITDNMVEAAANALSTSLNENEKGGELVYPRLDRIRDISAEVALAVARQAQNDGVDNNLVLRSLHDKDALKYIKGKMW